MALNYSQGSLQAARGRQFAKTPKADASKALGFAENAVKQQKDRLQDRLDRHKEMRQQLNEVSTVSLWDGKYQELGAKAKLLKDPATLDKMMSSEEGMLEFERLASELNDEIAVNEDHYKRTHGSPDDPITAATHEAQMQRDLSPGENFYEEDGFESMSTPEDRDNSLNRLQNPDFQEGSMKLVDGKFVYTDLEGNEITGSKKPMENPFDPKLQEMDISGFTHFRKRDDGKFDDEVEVTEFVKNNMQESEKHAQQALKHYAEESGLEPNVVMESAEQYYEKAEEMWVKEALDAWNEQKKPDTSNKPSEGDKRRAAEARGKKEKKQRFYDSVKIINRPLTETTYEELLPGFMPLPKQTTRDITETFIPLQGITGSMTVNFGGDEEKGQMRPQELRVVDGEYQVTGAYSFDRIQEGTTVRDTETRTINLDPNNFNHLSMIQQLEALGNRELDVSLQNILEDPSALGIQTTQWSPNDLD